MELSDFIILVFLALVIFGAGPLILRGMFHRTEDEWYHDQQRTERNAENKWDKYN